MLYLLYRLLHNISLCFTNSSNLGSCAISCVVNNGMLHVAGLGDCRAVLGNGLITES